MLRGEAVIGVIIGVVFGIAFLGCALIFGYSSGVAWMARDRRNAATAIVLALASVLLAIVLFAVAAGSAFAQSIAVRVTTPSLQLDCESLTPLSVFVGVGAERPRTDLFLTCDRVLSDSFEGS